MVRLGEIQVIIQCNPVPSCWIWATASTVKSLTGIKMQM